MITDICCLTLIISIVAGILLILERGSALWSWLHDKWRLVNVGSFRADRRIWK